MFTWCNIKFKKAKSQSKNDDLNLIRFYFVNKKRNLTGCKKILDMISILFVFAIIDKKLLHK